MSSTIALISDVHGNLPALEAVLRDARANGAASLVFGGDLASFGPWPAETVEALDEDPLPSAWIRGNWERWLATHPAADLPDHPAVAGATKFALGALDPGTVARLGELPEDHVEGTTRWSHARPGDDMAGLSATAGQEGEAEQLAGIREARFVTGHTHVQFIREGRAGERTIEIVNPGSVGLPWDGDCDAAYALLHPDGVELRRVPYDVEATVAALRTIGEPWSDIVVEWLQTASPQAGSTD